MSDFEGKASLRGVAPARDRSDFSAIHVIGGNFDAVYESGNPANAVRGVQTWTIPPAGGAIGVINVSKEADGKTELVP